MPEEIGKKPRSRIEQLGQELGAWSLSLLQGAIGHLPPDWIYPLGRWGGDLLFACLRKKRALAARNLQRVLDLPADGEPPSRLARQNFRHISVILLEMFRFGRLPEAEVSRRILVKGREHLEEAHRRGKGVICVSAHLGNFLLVPLRMGLDGYCFHVLVRAEKDSRVEGVFLETRERFGAKTLYKGQPYFSLVKILKGNGILWLFVDQFPKSSDLEVPFLTRRFPLYDGYARLARMTGAAIVPLAIGRLQENVHQIEIFPALREYGESEADRQAQAEELMGVLERQIRLRPPEWLWWHKNWFR
ncbi:MAG: lysophospholipid acyltransferase family protein [Candidatus Tectomicrobia bacterium]|uniref:Lysophospholipid acyltransferase family protein n=1 Tax=Tectimicrobiota bacterium TaxID=2528274 RepID=A0A932CMM5_UNCTE|nr:lysophospholipid acyltransferase family protein [Candidatus Tectomicrobia bacterium]